MGLSELNTIDIVSTDPDDTQVLHIVAGDGWRPENEALDYVELIIKLAVTLGYVAEHQGDGQRRVVRLIGPAEPPVSVLEYAGGLGVSAVVFNEEEDERPAVGKPPRYPNLPGGRPDIDALQDANARAFAERHGFDGSLSSLTRLDELLEERRRDEGLDTDDVDEDFEDGDLTVLAGAYTGEVLRSACGGGNWVIGPAGPHGAVHLRVGPADAAMTANVLGKVRKYLYYGAGDSVQYLARMVLTELGKA